MDGNRDRGGLFYYCLGRYGCYPGLDMTAEHRAYIWYDQNMSRCFIGRMKAFRKALAKNPDTVLMIESVRTTSEVKLGKHLIPSTRKF